MTRTNQATAEITAEVFADLVAHVNTGSLRAALDHEAKRADRHPHIFEAAMTLRDLIDETVCDDCGGIIGQCQCEDEDE